MRYLILLLLCLPHWGQAQAPALAWQHSYGTATNETGGYAAALPGGGYMLVANQIYLNGSATNLLLIRTNAGGDTLWTRRVDQRQVQTPEATGICADAAGNLIITGCEFARGFGNGFVLKLRPNGDTIWTKVYRPISSANNQNNVPVAYPLLANDGNYLVRRTQRVYNPNPLRPFFEFRDNIVKIDATTGNDIWACDVYGYLRALNFDTTPGVFGPAKAGNGYLVSVDGTLNGNTGGARGHLLISSTGTITGFRRRDGYYNIDNAAVFCNTADGNIISARRQNLTKLTPTGDTLWHTVAPQAYPLRLWDARGVVEDSQGNLLVAAHSRFSAGGNGGAVDVHMVRFSRNGRLLNDTLLYRGGSQNWVGSGLLAPNGRDLVFSGYTSAGRGGSSDLFMALYRGFRPLGTATAAAPPAPLAFYPNPVSAAWGPVTVLLPGPTGGTLTLYDGVGRRVRQQAVDRGLAHAPLDCAGLPPGLYVLRYLAANGRAYTGRLQRE